MTENHELLRITLQAAVPLWAERLKTIPLDDLMKRAPELAETIGSKGDVHAFNSLAEALAILSFSPGGVTFYGDHYETKHPEQPG